MSVPELGPASSQEPTLPNEAPKMAESFIHGGCGRLGISLVHCRVEHRTTVGVTLCTTGLVVIHTVIPARAWDRKGRQWQCMSCELLKAQAAQREGRGGDGRRPCEVENNGFRKMCVPKAQ